MGSESGSHPDMRYATTQAVSLDALLPIADPRHPSDAVSGRDLRLYVRGFSAMERQLLEGTVRLSQRRSPRLVLVPAEAARSADVLMIDGADASAVAWAEAQPWLAQASVIWINSAVPRPGHMMARRPVQWPSLPMLLARTMEDGRVAAAPAAPEAGARATPVAPASAAKPILVVDDSLAVRAYLRSQLEARDYHVAEVASAEAALDAVAHAPFACVLMDVLMPGVDGYEGCRQIKAKHRGASAVPVIMLTSKSSPFDRIRGKMAGCDAYLTKPVDPGQLHDVLARFVAAAASTPPNASLRAAASVPQRQRVGAA